MKKKIDELKPWEKNPRGIKKEDFQRLKKLILKLGIFKPFVITEDGTVLGGNMRLMAVRELIDEGKLDITEVPVTVVEADTEAKKIEYALADNDRVGYYEDEALAELLQDVDIDLGDYKVDLGQPVSLDDLLQQFGPDIEEDEAPEVEEGEPDSKLGEVYQLGRHRLMCGDATKIEDVEKLMDGKKADMVFTDPPYGIEYKDLKGHFKEIENDTPSEAFVVIRDSLAYFSNIPIYVCCNWQSYADIRIAMEDSGLPVKSCIVWDKRVGVQNLDKFYKRHEFILYSGLFGGQKTVDGDVWILNREVRKDHPTAKPVELCARAIKYSSNINGNVIDLFGGSGSTLIACEQTNRTCYMMELDPKYCDVIRKRYENYTEKTGK